jgi:hypothetical protein
MPLEVNSSSPEPAPQPAPLGLVRAMALAAIGLIGLVGDELEAAYERGVQRERQRASVGGKPSTGMSRLALDEWETTLAKLNLPTKSDIDGLTRQMDALEKQIDEIAARRNVAP